MIFNIALLSGNLIYLTSVFIIIVWNFCYENSKKFEKISLVSKKELYLLFEKIRSFIYSLTKFLLL
ncbi:MAG: hypothetical protein B6D61_05635 [Bacteroidetes bacterium 4484_249]|nr:MAG: hypothetical protein B6D61_05635 [Bacteroidetes bacterium 4484_249]